MREHRTAKYRPLHMRTCPDLGRPVDRKATIIQGRADADDLSCAYRLEPELVLSPPLHANTRTGNLHGDHGSVESDIIGPIMTVAAGTVCMPHGHPVAGQPHNIGDTIAQRVD